MEEKLVKIYALSNSNYPDNYRYIGKTRGELKRRLKQHISEAIGKRKNNTYKNNWIRKELLNLNNILITLIEEVKEKDWQEAEKYYIKYYKELGFNLTNSSQGGEGIIRNPIEKKEVKTIKKRKRKKGRPKKPKSYYKKVPKKIKNEYFIDKDGNRKVLTLGMKARLAAKMDNKSECMINQ